MEPGTSFGNVNQHSKPLTAVLVIKLKGKIVLPSESSSGLGSTTLLTQRLLGVVVFNVKKLMLTHCLVQHK